MKTNRRPSRLRGYLDLFVDCLCGNKSLSGAIESRNRRRHVTKWAAKFPDQPISVSIPTGGKMHLFPHSSFMEWHFSGLQNYETDIQEVLKQVLKPSATFVDCGCNLGFFSVMAADLIGPIGKVISVEANSLIIPLLNQTLADAGLNPAVNCALSTTAGSMELYIPDGQETLASLRENKLFGPGKVKKLVVPARTLDNVIFDSCEAKIDLIKIDVEGAELDVIRSGRDCLTKFRPMVIAEYSKITWPRFDVSPADVQILARDLHYDLTYFDLSAGKLMSLQAGFWNSDYANMVLVPR